MDKKIPINQDCLSLLQGLPIETALTFVPAEPALTLAADRRLQKISRTATEEYAESPVSQFMVEVSLRTPERN